MAQPTVIFGPYIAQLYHKGEWFGSYNVYSRTTDGIFLSALDNPVKPVIHLIRNNDTGQWVPQASSVEDQKESETLFYKTTSSPGQTWSGDQITYDQIPYQVLVTPPTTPPTLQPFPQVPPPAAAPSLPQVPLAAAAPIAPPTVIITDPTIAIIRSQVPIAKTEAEAQAELRQPYPPKIDPGITVGIAWGMLSVDEEARLQRNANILAGTGDVDAVAQMYQNTRVHPDYQGANNAVQNNDLKMLKWLHIHGVYPSVDGINKAAYFGYRTIFDWLMRNTDFVPGEGTADEAVSGSQDDMLTHVMSSGGNPTANGANVAASRGDYNMLQRLAALNIYPDLDGMYEAVKNGFTNIFYWLVSLGLQPNSDGANDALLSRYIPAVLFYKENGIEPTVDTINKIAAQGDLQLLRWLHRNEMEVPTEAGAALAEANGFDKVARWIREQQYEREIRDFPGEFRSYETSPEVSLTSSVSPTGTRTPPDYISPGGTEFFIVPTGQSPQSPPSLSGTRVRTFGSRMSGLSSGKDF